MSDPREDVRMTVWTICVADIEESTRFYCEGLGFTEGKSVANTIEPGSDMAKAFNVSHGNVRSRFLSRPDINLELVCFSEPKPIGGRGRKPTNQIGPRSMIFTCSDAKAVAARLADLGGKRVHDGRSGPFDALFVTDPDGFSIQLVTIPLEVFEDAFRK